MVVRWRRIGVYITWTGRREETREILQGMKERAFG